MESRLRVINAEIGSHRNESLATRVTRFLALIFCCFIKRENKSWDLVRFGGEVITIPNFVGPGITRFTREREREKRYSLSSSNTYTHDLLMASNICRYSIVSLYFAPMSSAKANPALDQSPKDRDSRERQACRKLTTASQCFCFLKETS